MKYLFILITISSFCFESYAQSIGNFIEDESALYAETKQVNQFFRRFNGEEDIKGERYYKKDKEFRTRKIRKKYLPVLFNLNEDYLNNELKEEFIELVNDKDNPTFLDFHGNSWFAELKTIFTYKGQEKELWIFLELQEEKVGSKWVISRIYFEPFYQAIEAPDTSVFNDNKFLHPLSHEIGFMNIFRVFNDPDSLVYYTSRSFAPDYISLFFYEIQEGNLKFKTVSDLRFHFFQIDGWYFKLEYYNRAGYNTGWLVSNLLKISPEEEQLLKQYIYHE